MGCEGEGACFIRREDVLNHQPPATLHQSSSAIQKEHSVFRSHFFKKKIEYNGSNLVQLGKTIKTKKVWRMGKDQSLEKDGDKSDFK